MSAYFDSALLVKAYCLEATSPQAIALLRAATPPLPFTHLHALEIANALRLKRHRRELTEAELGTALRHLQQDVDSGVLEKPDYELPEVFATAEELSAKHTVKTGARSLDVLHVAAALTLGVTEFISFDLRQRALAHQAGLAVQPQAIPTQQS